MIIIYIWYIYIYISSTGEKHHNKIEPGAGYSFFATRIADSSAFGEPGDAGGFPSASFHIAMV